MGRLTRYPRLKAVARHYACMNPDGRTELVDVDPETGTFRATYRYPVMPPSTAVATALMQATDSEITDLDPMHESTSVDPDALDDLFRPTESDRSRLGHVTFTYSDFRITVKSYGRIVFRPRDAQQTCGGLSG